MFNCRHIVTDIHLLNISHLLKRMNYIVDLYISVLGGIIVVSLHLLVAFRIITHILVIFCEFLVLVSLFTYQIFLFFLPLSWNSSVAYLSFSLLTFYSGAIFLRRKYPFLNIIKSSVRHNNGAKFRFEVVGIVYGTSWCRIGPITWLILLITEHHDDYICFQIHTTSLVIWSVFLCHG